MNINVNIPESLAIQLLTTWEDEIATNQARINELLKANEDMKESIRQLQASLNGKATNGHEAASDYLPDWSIFRKVVYLITNEGRGLTTKEIVNLIIDKYEKSAGHDRSKLVSTVSGVLSTKAKEKKLNRVTNVYGENVYSLPEG